jgi:hypothetical protein
MSRRRDIAEVLVEAGVTLGVAYMLTPGRAPLRPRVMYLVWRLCTRVASTAGRAGIRAEMAYRESVSK